MLGYDLTTVILVISVIALGGLVKGVSGIGLPIVTIAGLSTFLPIHLVLALSAIPIVMTNLWQAVHSGSWMEPLRRFWPMIVCLLAFIFVGARLAVTIDEQMFFAILGSVVVIFTLTTFLKPTLRLSPRAERWGGPVAGALGGLLGGVSTIWGPPMVMYFVMLHLPKDVFVRTVGLIWFSASIPLIIAYVDNGILNAETIPLSLYACIPGMAGLGVGQAIRRRINPETFRKVVLGLLFLIGLNLIRRAIIG